MSSIRRCLVAIKDIKTGVFEQPMTFMTPAQAERAWSQTVNTNDKTMEYHHPEDYGMYLLGHYDVELGIITPEQQPVLLYTGEQLKKRSN